MTSTATKRPDAGASVFVTTRWSVVLQAAAEPQTPRARAALENLCQIYWQPLYTYVRRRGYSPEDAQDLTQDFMLRLLERNRIAAVCPEKGRFRSFLLASMNHFLADEYNKARAQKRGGGHVFTVNWQEEETHFGAAATHHLTPEKAYEQRWALTLLEKVYQQLEAEQHKQGKGVLFEALRSTLSGRGADIPYADLGKQLGMSEGAVKITVHRLRQRYREILRETIADTVSSPAEVEDELRYLLRTFAN